MEVTDELVDKLANLAKLEFDGEKKTRIKDDFQKMLNFIEKLDEVDTTGVEPLIHLSDTITEFRDDQSATTVTHEEALKNAPQKDSDYFKVPKVLSKG
ncbi:Asp-tRNA(Asn)/Glu-tRNA(Gln) amidotransferase subunit GatC [bacterium]|nr:Asp-tRNA(Asn)/Glu-tRNA(Gln) amidotransferase subunit GatC [bacterium]